MTRPAILIAMVLALALSPPAPADEGERFVRGMTASFSGTRPVEIRLLSQQLPDLDQGHAVEWLRLGPPLDLWVLGPDENRMAAPGARLNDPSGAAVAPEQPGHWRADRPPLGYLELTVPALGRPWRLWSAFHPFMVRLDEPLALAVGEEPAAVFLPVTAGETLRMTARAVEGSAQLALVDGERNELARGAASDEPAELTCEAPAEVVRLEIEGPATVEIAVSDGSEWAAFAPWEVFRPSMPRVEIEGQTNLASGQNLDLEAVTSDPDDDIVEVVWQVPGHETVHGRSLHLAVPQLADFSVSVQARDETGNTAGAETLISPPAPHEVRPAGAAFLQAEDFAGQGGGEVMVTDRGHNVGRMITMWHANLGHWLEWAFAVPRETRYAIYLRYASGGGEPRRRLEIDGELPDEQFDSIAFEPTGGYGRSESEWRVRMLSPPVRLAAGGHVLRMTNLGDGMALDYLALVPAPEG
ncbi:MAG: hypothetical protein U9R79_10215 [Armatimonadota bacterium]|nr:hypothetical protein [Armatimonadota bacterium]